jgi:hypothetical protein
MAHGGPLSECGPLYGTYKTFKAPYMAHFMAHGTNSGVGFPVNVLKPRHTPAPFGCASNLELASGDILASLSLCLSLSHTHPLSLSHTHKSTLFLSLSLSHIHTHTLSHTLSLPLSYTHVLSLRRHLTRTTWNWPRGISWPREGASDLPWPGGRRPWLASVR